MDGHECSEVLLSELDFSNRLDSEYYKKQHLYYKNKIESLPHYELQEHSDFLIGPFGSAYDTNNYVEEPEYRYVRGQDVKPFELQESSPRYMAREDFERLKKYALKPGDILVSVVGTIGNTCIVRDKDVPGIFSCKSTVVRVKDYINPYFLTSYLNCKYGYSLLARQERGALQKGLNLDDLKVILVPDFTNKFQYKFEELLKKVAEIQDLSKKIYESAELLLEKEIGIDMSTITNGSISVKSFAESFGTSGRLDAEYYQSKFDTLVTAIKKINHDKLCNIVNTKKSIEPGSNAYQDEGIPFIRISDMSRYEISVPDKYIEPGSIYDDSSLYFKKDEILFSKDGSVGIAFKIKEDTKMISSSALLHLTIKENKDVLPDYLTLVLNSEIVQLQAERDAGGSIIKHWKPSEIDELLIPVLDHSTQVKIAQQAQHSFELRERSKELLECAKTAVEMAIEQDESTAIAWLDGKIAELTKED
jgi:type I restriction enzyme S subunit